MKKKLTLFTLTAIMMAAISTAWHSAANTSAAEQYIGEIKAEEIALEDAGAAEAEVTYLRTNLEQDDRHMVYEVKFHSGNIKYDYEIDAVSGTIMELDMDAKKDAKKQALPAAAAAQNYINEENAKAAVLEHAGLAADQAEFTKTKLDYDDGRTVYEMKFYSGTTKYNYEVDALSGEIVEYDFKTEYRPAIKQDGTASASSSEGTVQYISRDKAKSIALTEAGIAETEIRKLDIELDREHGIMVYEVEFKSGRMEYEYEIDAVDGTLLKTDVEYDD